MPKIDMTAVTVRKGSGYPPPFHVPCAARTRRRLGEAGGVRDFGVNLMTLPPGSWSSQRHWHSHEDEFVYVLEGEIMLIEDGGATVLHSGDAAGFKAGVSNGHHLVNKSQRDALYLEVGTRAKRERAHYSDVDLVYDRDASGFRFSRRSGEPYPKSGI